MIDQLRQMAIFAKVIDHGSFRGAARSLQLSPSVVSHHISQLEEHLGVTLLYRSTRKLTLTPDGERLLLATRKMLDAVVGELLDISGSANEPSGELRIAMSTLLSQSPLANVLAKFSIRYPRIKLSLNYSDERQDLISGGFDLAIRLGLNVKDSKTSRLLFRANRKLVCSAAYLDQKTQAKDPSELKDWDWLLLSPAHDRGISFSKDGRSIKLKPSARVSCNDVQSLYHLASEHVGLATVPEFLSSSAVAAGTMVYPIPDWHLQPITVFAEWPLSASRHGLIQLLVDELSTLTDV